MRENSRQVVRTTYGMAGLPRGWSEVGIPGVVVIAGESWLMVNADGSSALRERSREKAQKAQKGWRACCQGGFPQGWSGICVLEVVLTPGKRELAPGRL